MVKLLCFVWVLVTIVINAFALSGLLMTFGIAAPDWQGPLAVAERLYAAIADPVFNSASGMLTNRFDVTLPDWSVHALLGYAATASAIAASGMGIARREDLIDGVKSSSFSAAWPVGIAMLIWKSVRSGLVTRFLRDHTIIVALYAAAVAGVYFGAGYVNETVAADSPLATATDATDAASDADDEG